MPGLSVGIGVGLGRGGSAAWSPADVPGLLAEYRFDDGTGTQLTDYSGNAYHGTLGTSTAAPSWSATGLSFDGADRVTIPVPIEDVKTVVLWGSQTTGASRRALLASDAADGLSWVVGFSAWGHAPKMWLNGVGDGTQAVFDSYQFPGGNGVAFTHDGVADKIWVNGWPCGSANVHSASADLSATGRTGDLVIGDNLVNGSIDGWNGTMAGMLLYSTALTDDEIASATAYLRGLAVARGMADYASGFTGRRLWVEGDSISTNLGGAITAWPTVATGLYADAWTTINRATGGYTMLGIVQAVRSRTLHQYAAGATENVLVLFAGSNDGLGGATAAATFGYLQTAVGYATAAGFDVVIVPMISRHNGLDTFKNSYNALINGAAWGAGVRVVPTAAMPDLVPDNSHANTTYFSDGVHPTQAGADEIAAAVAVEVDAIAA